MTLEIELRAEASEGNLKHEIHLTGQAFSFSDFIDIQLSYFPDACKFLPAKHYAAINHVRAAEKRVIRQVKRLERVEPIKVVGLDYFNDWERIIRFGEYGGTVYIERYPHVYESETEHAVEFK